MSEMGISVEDGDRGPVVQLTGDLDLPGGDALEALVTPMISNGTVVEIDMAEVEFLDSSGLGALIVLSQLASEGGGNVVLRAPSKAVMSALNLTHTADIFTLEGVGERP